MVGAMQNYLWVFLFASTQTYRKIAFVFARFFQNVVILLARSAETTNTGSTKTTNLRSTGTTKQPRLTNVVILLLRSSAPQL